MERKRRSLLEFLYPSYTHTNPSFDCDLSGNEVQCSPWRILTVLSEAIPTNHHQNLFSNPSFFLSLSCFSLSLFLKRRGDEDRQRRWMTCSIKNAGLEHGFTILGHSTLLLWIPFSLVNHFLFPSIFLAGCHWLFGRWVVWIKEYVWNRESDRNGENGLGS